LRGSHESVEADPQSLVFSCLIMFAAHADPSDAASADKPANVDDKRLLAAIVYDGILKARGMVAWSANMTRRRSKTSGFMSSSAPMRTRRWNRGRRPRAPEERI
jgi:hypothetical protein